MCEKFALEFKLIISFSVENFRSFGEEQTLSLVSSPKLSGGHENHTIRIPGAEESVLRTAVLYGANGAGKSNIVRALVYLRRLALNTRKQSSGMGRSPFRLGLDASSPTTLDLQFVDQNQVYRYGITMSDREIDEEWLVLLQGGRERVVYERSVGPEGDTVIRLGTSFEHGEKLKALASVGGPINQTFLATAKANLKTDDLGDELFRVWEWFDRKLKIIGPETTYSALGHDLAKDTDFLSFAGEFLHSASTGVERLAVSATEISEEDLKKKIPEKVLADLFDRASSGDVKEVVVGDSTGKEFLIELGEPLKVQELSIKSSHKKVSGEDVLFELKDESDGTKRLLHLIPTLHRYKGDSAVFVIDEIDRSLHPILVRKFLEFFLKACGGETHQLLITTHESTLLDLELLRRDEIWFAEKNSNNETRIYSLSDFKVRNDLRIRNHYLEGRFGGIPFLGNIDRLVSRERDEVSLA